MGCLLGVGAVEKCPGSPSWLAFDLEIVTGEFHFDSN